MIANALADTYACLFYIDMDTGVYTSYKNNLSQVMAIIPPVGNMKIGFERFAKYLCQPEYSQRIKEFVDVDTLNDRMRSANSISLEFEGSINPWCLASFVVCDRHDDGSIHHLIIGIKDITMEKEAELKRAKVLKDSIEANHAKTKMLQNMTHEIRTPLNAMYGFSQLLCLPDGCVTEEEKSEYMNYINNSFQMLNMLIDDVLDLADAEHGNYRISVDSVKVNDICRAALQMAELRKPANVNMFLTTDVDDSFMIESDGRRIQQVLINLLTNSCKHTQEGEIELKVSLDENTGRVTLSVRDTGGGIPEEKAKDIFKRYTKANAMVMGSGLGLNICSMIADKLRADIYLDESYKTGARFVFVL